MNYLDTDELGEEYEELKERKDDPEDTLSSDDLDRFNLLFDFAYECGIDPDSNYGWADVGPGIPVDEFVNYAQDFAYDVGAVNEVDIWPNYCIDWERAAKELAYDYNLVEFQGYEYYVRIV
jgi:hypothetical protein